MSHYIRIGPDGAPMGVWRIEDGVAIRIGISNPEHSPGAYFKAESGETIWEAMRRQAVSWFEPGGQNPFHETVLGPGEYYPRMARPIDQHPHDAPGQSPGALNERNVVAVARGQLVALTRQLERICQTVQPTERTFGTFGHDIRNLLILACTEAEAHWRGVLIANGATNDRFNTRDYAALRDAMKLDEYAVAFPGYPWLAALRPYENWGKSGKPTQDLKWYDAYNAAKHDRETQFGRATLQHAFEAVAACVIMMAAQFGTDRGLGQRSELRAFFNLSAVPSWPPSHVCIYPYGDSVNGWTPRNFPF